MLERISTALFVAPPWQHAGSVPIRGVRRVIRA